MVVLFWIFIGLPSIPVALILFALILSLIFSGTDDPAEWTGTEAAIYLTWPLWLSLFIVVGWYLVARIPRSPLKQTPRTYLQRRRAKAKAAREVASEAARAEAVAAAAIRDAAAAAAHEIRRKEWQALKENLAKGPRDGVRARVPSDADDFETVCAEWLNACGLQASRTAKGPDGGLDVVGVDYGGQCKFHPSQKIGAPDIQQLVGAARQARKSQMSFFHYGPGYTDSAIMAARQLGVSLWRFDPNQQTFRREK
jgi:hypothetical protein